MFMESMRRCRMIYSRCTFTIVYPRDWLKLLSCYLVFRYQQEYLDFNESLSLSSGWVMLGDREYRQLGQISRRFPTLGQGPFAFACSTNAGPGVLGENRGWKLWRFLREKG